MVPEFALAVAAVPTAVADIMTIIATYAACFSRLLIISAESFRRSDSRTKSLARMALQIVSGNRHVIGCLPRNSACRGRSATTEQPCPA